jgi:transposase-like protein
MRCPAAEKLEIIGVVEQSHLSARKTLDQIGVPRATFYRWYDQYQTGGPEALEDIRDIAQTRMRYGYFRIYILLRREGWIVNHKRV